MDIKDALIVTGLGVSVVFLGLILTNLLIFSFSLFPRLYALFKTKRTKKKPEPGKTEPTVKPKTPPPPVEPEILAVITTVIEAEWRLRTALME